MNTKKLIAQEWRRSFECFFDQCVNKKGYACQFVQNDLRNFFGKDYIRSVRELTSLSSMLLPERLYKDFFVEMSTFKSTENKVKINK